MKIALFYFSGTGNTEKTIKQWKEEIIKLNETIELFNIEKNNFDFSILSKYDKIGFAYPIHAFNAPEIVWRVAKKIPKMKNKINLFIIMVSGEYLSINHSSYMKLVRILKRRNIILESDYHYLMPYNMIFRHSENTAYKMYETMKQLAAIDVYEYLIKGINHHCKKLHFMGWFIFLIRIEQIFSKINGRFYKIDENKCIKCMECVNHCPVHNIEYKNDKFIFHNKCILCTRCSFNCPQDAFKIGLLNNWRVNKPYLFIANGPKENDKHAKYLKKSYEKYYSYALKRINIFKS